MNHSFPTVLITGAAKRIGAVIARTLHQAGMNVILHYYSSENSVTALYSELNNSRPDSAYKIRADLQDIAVLPKLIANSGAVWGRLDCLINNAAIFSPTPIAQTTLTQWEALIGTNLRAPFFLAQYAAPWLCETKGCIINLIDIYADRPLVNHSVYNISKAGLAMLTKTLAQELAPQIRVNAVAPGAILWPDRPLSNSYQESLLARTPLQRIGNPDEVAQAVLFLIQQASYITGHILTVDGGRSIMP